MFYAKKLTNRLIIPWFIVCTSHLYFFGFYQFFHQAWFLAAFAVPTDCIIISLAELRNKIKGPSIDQPGMFLPPH